MKHMIFPELSRELLGMAFNILGPGLLENAYEGAMARELTLAGIAFERQKTFSLFYKDELIGAYIADLVVDSKIIIELKSVQILKAIHSAQLINYLRLSKIQVGYLINFHGLRVEWKRHAFTPE